MLFSFPLYASVYAVAAILTIFSAAAVIWRRASPGSFPFALSLLSLTIWSFASIFEAGALTPQGKLIASIGQYIGITTLTPFWLYFCAEYGGFTKVFNKPYRYLIWIIPLVTMILAVTNDYHGLIWKDIVIPVGSPDNIAVYYHGVFFYFFVGYTYAGLLLGTYWLVRHLSTFHEKKRLQVTVIISSLAIGWIANVLYQIGLTPIRGLDLTPISFVFIALVLTWFIYRGQLFDLLPIARSILVDNMSDGVIVLDNDSRVVDFNQAAIDITDYHGKNPVGDTIWDMYEDYLPQISHLRNKTDLQVELEMPTDPPRYLDVKIDSIGEKNDQGQVVTIRDITSRKKMELKERQERLFSEALTEITSLLNSSLNFDEVLGRILENAGKVVPHDTANIGLLDEDGMVKFEKIKGYEKYGVHNTLLGRKIKLEDLSNMKHMAETGQPAITPDTYSAPEWHREMSGTEWIRSYIGAPIISGGKILGFISLDSETPNFFKPEHMTRLQVFANQAAIAIKNAQLYQEMRHLAITDSLTGLYNRRYFFEFSENEIEQSRRYQKPLSMIMIDIDHFKMVNDRFSHQVGDQVLKSVVDICLSILRKADIMCRFGGEEFVVLLPETNIDAAGSAAVRMCEAISDAVIHTKNGDVKITMSIGVAGLEKDHDTLDSLIFAADKALYKAKMAGRNCVRIFD